MEWYKRPVRQYEPNPNQTPYQRGMMDMALAEGSRNKPVNPYPAGSPEAGEWDRGAQEKFSLPGGGGSVERANGRPWGGMRGQSRR